MNHHPRTKLQRILNSAQIRAKSKNLKFDLKGLKKLKQPKRCPILGILLDYNLGLRYNSISLDRVDPSKGYTFENTRIVSYRANAIKNTATLKEHRRVLRYMEKNLVPRA